MNLLDRYFIREYLKPLGVCLLAFLLCMVVYDLYDNINDFIQAKAPLGKILHYYLILIPAWIVQIMPITLLLALLYVLSDMSKHGELTAMRASGLDFFRLMGPYFVIGICVTIQMLSLNLAWAPNALYEAKVLFEKTTGNSQDPKSKAFGVMYRDLVGNRSWFISVLDPVTRTASSVEVTQASENQKDVRKISAKTATFNDGFWTFHDVMIYDYTLPITDPDSLRLLVSYPARDFKETPQQLIAASKKTKRMTTKELLQNLRYAARLAPRQHALYATEFQSRIAFPMANLVVFLIGIPFGVVGQRRSNFLAIVNALLFFFAYMLLSQLLSVIAQSGRLPAWIAAWLPIALFTGIGIYMIRKIR